MSILMPTLVLPYLMLLHLSSRACVQLAECYRALFVSTMWINPLLLRLVALVCFSCFLKWPAIAFALFIGCGLLLLITWLELELHTLELNARPLKIIKTYNCSVIFCLFLRSCFL